MASEEGRNDQNNVKFMDVLKYAVVAVIGAVFGFFVRPSAEKYWKGGEKSTSK